MYEYIGDWGHPAKQKMARFVRVGEAPKPGLVHRGRRWVARHVDPGPR